ncbi:MAG: amidohydrolase [Candidatus Cloacimonetes bacterium]|jgi:N-acetyldiaminopimelate deacetylase|nr:amidohydrolase [Candidatus Cloacimonadota bacterium]MBT6993343.1 amidohydrolase [Candidatus Cloacimonadota bacterium]MBT7468825.1 amidohydrolase [Candidatus Cloacimonadota bacterium]
MLNFKKIRRDLHQIPELAFEEFETQKYLLQILETFPNIKIHTFDFTGIMVEYSPNSGKHKLFRADMDGLPILESTACDFTSKNEGKMHACGHDVHLTILLGLIEKIISEKIEQNLLFLFQPAEEGKGGAKRIIENGILKNFDISEAFALHVTDDLKIGEISSKGGIFFANTQEVDVEFIGKSAHVAFPENGKDAIFAAIEFYLEIQKEKTRNSICAFGKISGGTAVNAVAENCKLSGTFRTFSHRQHQITKNKIEQTVHQMAEKHQLKANLSFFAYYKEVVNSEKLYHKLKKITVKNNYKFIEAKKVFTGEDFGFFTDKYEGILFWLGARLENCKKTGLHSTNFLPDEKAIEVGINLLFQLI